jgi:hypothetical protein
LAIKKALGLKAEDNLDGGAVAEMADGTGWAKWVVG